MRHEQCVPGILKFAPAMSTSGLGLDTSALRTALPFLTSAIYILGIGGGLYTYQDPADGAKLFGIVLPGSTPTPTETAYTKIHGIRNFANGAIGLLTVGYLQLSSYCTSLPQGPFVAPAVRRVLGYSMLVGSIVGLTDGYTLYQFSTAQGVSAEAAEHAKKQRLGHVGMALPTALLGLGWLYA